MARQPPKCCGCVPLRPGLLAWAYIKLVLAFPSAGMWVYLWWYDMEQFIGRVEYSRIIISLLKLWPLGVCLPFLVFAIIFIIGVHRQSSKLLLVFLVYSMFEVMLAGAAVGWRLYDFVNRVSNWYSMYDSETFHMILEEVFLSPRLYLEMLLPVVVNMLLPIYLIVLIKREVQRLKTAREETRVVLDIPVTKEQDKTCNLGYSNETPVRGEPLFPVEELERLRQQLGVKNV